jgi:hypothetical protein
VFQSKHIIKCHFLRREAGLIHKKIRNAFCPLQYCCHDISMCCRSTGKETIEEIATLMVDHGIRPYKTRRLKSALPPPSTVKNLPLSGTETFF